MARQLELEHCGWEFWRDLAGAFYSDIDSALVPLCKLLNKREVYSEGDTPQQNNEKAQKRR